MTVLSTDSARFSGVVKHEYAPETRYCRATLTVNEAAAITYHVGTVLGKVTATGKYKMFDSTASDGSQNAVAVVIADNLGISHDISVLATTDTPVLCLVRGPVIVSDQLTFGSGAATATELAAASSGLAGVGILVDASA